MIIVTGANGFIGSAIVWQLNQAGITDIIAIDSVGLETRNLLQKRQYTRFFEAQELWSFLASPEAKKKCFVDNSHGRVFINNRNQLGFFIFK